MSLTIQDVADKAGVSVTTVSRVLNNKGRISQQTRDEVWRVVNEIGYKPRKYNVNNEMKTIAFIYNSRYLEGINNNPFYGEVVNGLELVLKEHNYHPILKTISGKKGENDEEKNKITQFVNNSSLDGIVIISYEIDRDFILKLKQTGKPLVLVDNDLWEDNIDSIVNDNLNGSKQIINHLLELGHEKIFFMGGPLNHDSLKYRFKGYKSALGKAGIEIDDDLIHFCDPYKWSNEAYEITTEILNSKGKKPTAFFAVSDNLAMAIMKAILKMGFSIPGDFSVAGFDDMNIALQMHPSLTTVKVHKERMGIEAGERLIELINQKKQEPIKQIISVKPVLRDSTGPVHDPEED
ncbi:MAG: LacI family DNA-binding transcriptional regulator [Bacillota bacterium]